MLPHANHSRVERVNGNRVYDGMVCDVVDLDWPDMSSLEACIAKYPLMQEWRKTWGGHQPGSRLPCIFYLAYYRYLALVLELELGWLAEGRMICKARDRHLGTWVPGYIGLLACWQGPPHYVYRPPKARHTELWNLRHGCLVIMQEAQTP